MNGRGLWAVIGHGDAPEHVLGRSFRDFLDHVEIPPFVEHSHVRQFQFRSAAAEFLVFLADRRVGIHRVRVLVERLRVGMRGRGIQVIVTFLHVFAVVSLVPAEAEKPLLQNRIFPIPKRGGEAHPALAVRPPLQAIFTPAESPAACMIVGECRPRIAMIRVILPDGSPLTLTEKRPPTTPAFRVGTSLRHPFFFPIRHLWAWS